MKKQKRAESIKMVNKTEKSSGKPGSFKNMKLKGKLILLTLLVAVIASISSFLSMSYIGTLTKRCNVAVQYYGIAQGEAGKAVVLLGDSRQSVRDILTFELSTATFEKKYNEDRTLYEETEGLVTSNAYSQEEKELCSNIAEQSKQFFAKADAIIEEGKTLTQEARRSMFLKVQNELDPLYDELYSSYSDLMDVKTTTANAEAESIEKSNVYTCATLIGIVILSVAVAVCVGAAFARKIVGPIDELLQVSHQISEGNLDVQVKIHSKDEVGELADGFVHMADNLKNIIGDVQYLLGRMSQGDFSVDSEHSENYIGDYRNILTAVQGINDGLSSTMLEINDASDQVNVGSDQVSSGAQALSQGTTEQAASVEELSATISEIAEEIKLNAEHAAEARRMSGTAGQQVAQSNRQMQQLVDAMAGISDTSNQISKIIKTIDDIAFQTNILALNAAVEAARAGSAGKGFAVVADEVRNLAGKSAEAAKSTTALIESTVKAITDGTVMAEETAKSLNAVVEQATAVDQTIQKIAEASERQATSISQVTTGIDQISAVVQTNSATAEQSAAASEELNGQAQMLRDLVEQFRLKDQETVDEKIKTAVDEKNIREDYPKDTAEPHSKEPVAAGDSLSRNDKY